MHVFFISNTFTSNARLKLAKIKQMLSNTLRLNFYYLKIVHILHPRYYPKIIGHILKNKQKNNCVCIYTINHNENEKKDHNKYNIGCNYSKYKKCLSMMMLKSIKQHLSNIWSSVHAKVKQRWGWVEKKRCSEKMRLFKKQSSWNT